MANCNNNFTWQDLLDSIWAYEASCAKKTFFLKRLLRNFYYRTMDLNDNRLVESISIPSWDANFVTTKPIYKVWWFHWRWSWSQFESLHQHLPRGTCDWVKTKRLIFDRWVYHLDDWQYRLDSACDNKVYIKTPCEITNATIMYSRWPDSITNNLSSITMKDSLLTWLEYLAEEMRASLNQDYNNTWVVKWQFDEWLKMMKEQQALATEFVNP